MCLRVTTGVCWGNLVVMVSTAIGNGNQSQKKEIGLEKFQLSWEPESPGNVKRQIRVLKITCTDLLSMHVCRCYPRHQSLEHKIDSAFGELIVSKACVCLVLTSSRQPRGYLDFESYDLVQVCVDTSLVVWFWKVN